jgi:hypothetical protein
MTLLLYFGGLGCVSVGRGRGCGEWADLWAGLVPDPSSWCDLFCPGFQRFVHLLKTAPGIGIEHP